MVALFLSGPKQGSSDVHTSIDGIVKLGDTSPPGSEILDPDTNCQYAQDNSCFLGQRVLSSLLFLLQLKNEGGKKKAEFSQIKSVL